VSVTATPQQQSPYVLGDLAAELDRDASDSYIGNRKRRASWRSENGSQSVGGSSAKNLKPPIDRQVARQTESGVVQMVDI